MNIAQLALTSLTAGEHVSIIFEGKEYTNVQMDITARKLGNALKKLGVKRGDRIILQMPNSPEVFQGFQGIWKIGAIVVPINYQVGAEETAYIYQDSGANTVITTPEFMDKVRETQAKSPGVKNVIVVSEAPIEGTLSLAKLLRESSDKLEIVQTDDNEVAALVYTSGTTSKRNGV